MLANVQFCYNVNGKTAVYSSQNIIRYDNVVYINDCVLCTIRQLRKLRYRKTRRTYCACAYLFNRSAITSLQSHGQVVTAKKAFIV